MIKLPIKLKSLIDTFRFIPTFNDFVSSNIQGGVNSIENGLMSSEEVKRKYNANPLKFYSE